MPGDIEKMHFLALIFPKNFQYTMVYENIFLYIKKGLTQNNISTLSKNVSNKVKMGAQ